MLQVYNIGGGYGVVIMEARDVDGIDVVGGSGGSGDDGGDCVGDVSAGDVVGD